MNEKTENIKLMLVDDHELVRTGFKSLLMLEKDIELIGEAYDSVSFFQLLVNQNPDVVVLDIEMPGLSGIEIAYKLEEEYPQIKKILLSANITKKSIAEAIDAGVLGILPKTCTKDEFIAAIRKAYIGDAYYNSFVADLIIKDYVNTSVIPSRYENKDAKLSDRELEVIRCFAEGMIYKEIADKLSISPRTVESHKLNILQKLGLNTIIDLVKYAIKNNIVSI